MARQFLLSASAMGGASVVSLLANLGKMKIAALTIGPSGIGLLGSLQNVIALGVTLFALGLTVAGSRQLAEAAASAEEEAAVKTVVSIARLGIVLSLLGGVTASLLVPLLSTDFIQHEELGSIDLYASVAITLTIFSCVPGAVLLGYRKIKSYAAVLSASAVLSALGGSYLIWTLGLGGIGPFLLLPPLLTVSISLFLARGLIPWCKSLDFFVDWLKPISTLLKVGAATTAAAGCALASQLLIRNFLVDHASLTEVGLMQAVWAISAAGTGIVVSSMWADLIPRLAGSLQSKQELGQAINYQTRLAVAVCAPAFILVIALAPLVLFLLYSREFVEAGPALSLQLAGDLLKVAASPLGCLLIARGHARAFMFVEISSALVFSTAAYFLIEAFGLYGVAMANVAAFAAYLIVIRLLLARDEVLLWDGETTQLLLVLGVATLVAVAAAMHPHGWVLQAMAFIVAAGFSGRKLLAILQGARTASAASIAS